jgi:hypothetical protein
VKHCAHRNLALSPHFPDEFFSAEFPRLVAFLASRVARDLHIINDKNALERLSMIFVAQCQGRLTLFVMMHAILFNAQCVFSSKKGIVKRTLPAVQT